jgi:hypothetical protein
LSDVDRYPELKELAEEAERIQDDIRRHRAAAMDETAPEGAMMAHLDALVLKRQEASVVSSLCSLVKIKADIERAIGYVRIYNSANYGWLATQSAALERVAFGFSQIVGDRSADKCTSPNAPLFAEKEVDATQQPCGSAKKLQLEAEYLTTDTHEKRE